MTTRPLRPRASEGGWLDIPRDWIASLGDIIGFSGRAFGDIFNGRVFHFFGETMRQAGILILGSAHRDLVDGVHPRPHAAGSRPPT